MEENGKLPSRRQIHLSKCEYGKTGRYFVTICTQQRICQFGKIISDRMILNEAGQMVQKVWESLPVRFSNVTLDCYQIMPNHIHGILMIKKLSAERAFIGSCICKGASCGYPNLFDIIGGFKSITTDLYISGVRQHNWPRFPGKLWQRRFYDHIIRNDKEFDRIREYIENNPIQWGIDRENPNK
jgi:REP element-mobilizing transposase RayT